MGHVGHVGQLSDGSDGSWVTKCDSLSALHCSIFFLHVPKCTLRVYDIIIITGSQNNFTKGRIAAAHGRFSRMRQMAPMCTPSNTCFLGPTQVHIPNGISTGSAVLQGS